MTGMINLLGPNACRLCRDAKGGVLVEFALLAPLLFGMLFGVFQVGIHLQNYNALKSVASDSGRRIAVEYQKGLPLTDSQMEDVVEATGATSPYFLDIDKIDATVRDVETSRVPGAIEKELVVTYKLPNFLGFIGVGETSLSYERPLFLAQIGPSGGS